MSADIVRDVRFATENVVNKSTDIHLAI